MDDEELPSGSTGMSRNPNLNPLFNAAGKAPLFNIVVVK